MKKLVLSQDEVDLLVTVERATPLTLVHNFGRNDAMLQARHSGQFIWQYDLWKNMLKRCFCQKLKLAYPTYKDVTCCDEWLSFANFLEWVNKEVDYKGKPDGYQFDKDLIIRGNKVYSPEACSFVPRSINMLLVDSGSTRGEYPMGVCMCKPTKRFNSYVTINGKQKHLGYYDTPEEAFLAYKVAKEAQIKAVANQYKDVLKPAVYESLMSWEIEP